MTIKNVALPLFDDAYYTYAVSLEGQSYVLEFSYNERTELYFLSLLTADKKPIVMGMALVPTYPISLDYALEGLSGFFWMESKSNITDQPYKVYPDKLRQYYNFYYVFND